MLVPLFTEAKSFRSSARTKGDTNASTCLNQGVAKPPHLDKASDAVQSVTVYSRAGINSALGPQSLSKKHGDYIVSCMWCQRRNGRQRTTNLTPIHSPPLAPHLWRALATSVSTGLQCNLCGALPLSVIASAGEWGSPRLWRRPGRSRSESPGCYRARRAIQPPAAFKERNVTLRPAASPLPHSPKSGPGSRFVEWRPCDRRFGWHSV